MTNKFTKADLKMGMVVEFECGKKGEIADYSQDGKLPVRIVYGVCGSLSLEHYDDGLLYYTDPPSEKGLREPDYDIVKVENTIWQRPTQDKYEESRVWLNLTAFNISHPIPPEEE